ncbi:MAG: carbohydrate ABC transporter permease [Chloroflexi bacterium]|nr:carbohydrate ABC transporter permease [Chloroflexota bacterium]
MTSDLRREHLARYVIYTSLIVLVAVYSVPTLGVLLSSIQLDREITRHGLWRWPGAVTLENYERVLGRATVPNYLKNSFSVTVTATAFSIAFGVLTGYVFSRLAFRGSEFLYLAVVAGLFFPPQIVIIPLKQLFSKTPINDTIWVLVVVHVAFGLPITTLLLRNFFSTIPAALREAAIIDGANEGQILLRVMLPLSLPALAVLATLQFTWIWNDFLWPFVLLSTNAKAHTIMAGIVLLKGQYDKAWGVQGALSVIASLPTLLIFLFFQRYFIRGLTLGAVKG